MPDITFTDGPAAGAHVELDHAPHRLAVLVGDEHPLRPVIVSPANLAATLYRRDSATDDGAVYRVAHPPHGQPREQRYGGVDEDDPT